LALALSRGALRLTPRHHPPRSLALRLFDRYVRVQVGKHFSSARLGPIAAAEPGWDRTIPTLFIANHSNWWDGFFAFLVGRELGLTSHLLMDAENLGRYPLFRLVGALPLRRESPRGGYQDLAASGAYLEPGAALWIFPQGARRPQGERPARLSPGAAEVALRHDALLRICPVAFRYVYLGEQLPEAFGWLGRPWLLEPGCYGHRRALMPVLERDLLVAVDTLDDLLRAESLGGFRTIVEGRLSINKRMDRIRHAVGLLRGRFEPRNG
jgi:1-acyl-sn-glycerol-3-phosphate acyltransferase